MEEILASIRRIIADEPQKSPAAATQPASAAPAPRPAAVPPPAPVDDDEEAMELTPKPKVKVLEPHFITDDPVENDLSFEDPAASAPKGQDDIDALMAAEAPQETAPAPVFAPAPAPLPPAPAAFAPQPQPIAFSPPPPPAAAPPAERLISPETDKAATMAFSSLANTMLARNARTLDDLMQDMLRPMIKSWLDDNLPTVVERLVKAEIERVSRGGR